MKIIVKMLVIIAILVITILWYGKPVIKNTVVKVVYLTPMTNGLLSQDKLKEYPEIKVVYDFESLKQYTTDHKTKIALWIDKNTVNTILPGDWSIWFKKSSQGHSPVVYIGNSNDFHVFRDILSISGFSGPIIPENTANAPGYSVWMLNDVSSTHTDDGLQIHVSYISEGFKEILNIDNILETTSKLLLNEPLE